MKVFEAAVFLVFGTALVMSVTMSFLLFPHPLSLSNPTLFMEGIFIAGLVFVGLAARKLLHINRTLSGRASSASSLRAAT